MAKVSIPVLLEAGTHFGHQTRRWNPKMKPYIFGSRGDIYIIDLKQTLIGLDRAYSFISDKARKGGTILFVGTKKQAQEAVADAANRCGMPYVNARWLGGMLTNFVTIRTRVEYMEELEAMEADGRMALLPKKEQIKLRKELAKLQTNLNGIRNMKKVPDAIFVVDTNREEIAIHEARRLDVPIVGTLDTNCDPDDVDYGIPANDDAIRSVRLLVDFIADAVIAGAGVDISAAEMAGVEAQALAADAAAVTAAADAITASAAVADAHAVAADAVVAAAAAKVEEAATAVAAEQAVAAAEVASAAATAAADAAKEAAENLEEVKAQAQGAQVAADLADLNATEAALRAQVTEAAEK